MPHLVDIHVGQRLKHLRVLRGLTQTDVAEGLGISFQQVQKYESGRILAVQPGYFFEGIDEDICPQNRDARRRRSTHCQHAGPN